MELAQHSLFAFDDGLNVSRFNREVLAFDKLSMRSFDVDGRLHVEKCNISKSTVNPYLGKEIPDSQALGLDPDRIYYLYRDPEELAKAAPTFCNLQLLDLHTPVDANTPKLDRTCGTIGSDVQFDGTYLTASIAVWTQHAIDLIESKQAAQLSSSYRYTADMTPGLTQNGIAYDGVMRNIIGNHVALVKEGRAGPDVFVSDELPLELSKMNSRKLIAALKPFLKNDSVPALLALDAELEKADDESDMDAYDSKEAAMDAREEDMDKREEAEDEKESAMDANPDPEGTNLEAAKGDRKKARDARKKARDARAKDRKARDAKRASDKKARDMKSAKDAGTEGGDPGAGPNTGEVGAALDHALKTGKFITSEQAKQLAEDAVNAAVARVNQAAEAKRKVEPLVGVITSAMDSAEEVYAFALKKCGVTVEGVHVSALPALVDAQIAVKKASANAQPKFARDAAISASNALPIGRIRH